MPLRIRKLRERNSRLKAYSTLNLKSIDDDKRVITGVASTPKADRVRDVVEPEGARFTMPMPLLWMHDGDDPVGTVLRAMVTSKGIKIRAQLSIPDDGAPPLLRNRLDEAWWKVKKGLVRGLSIGFTPLERSYLDNGGEHFIEWDWYELSLVTIPANADASISTVKQHARNPKGSRIAQHHTRKARSAAIDRKGEKMPTIGEQIAALEDKRREVAARIKQLGDKEIDGADLTDEEVEEFEELEKDLDEIDAKKARLETVERAGAAGAGARAKRISGGDPSSASKSRGDDEPRRKTTVEFKKKEGEEGLGFARVLTCYAYAEFAKMNPADVAEEFYRDRDPRVASFIKAFQVMKAAVAGGHMGDGGWAGDIASAQDVTDDFLQYLRPRTLVGRFGAAGVPSLRRMPLNSALNGLVGGLSGFFVGEGLATPISKGQVGNQPLLPFEAAGATVISKKNLRFGSPAFETAIRDDLVASIRQVEDDGFVNPVHAASNTRPASITNGVTPLTSQGDDAASVRKDLQKLIDPIETANMDPDEVVIMMHSRLARAASLMRTEFGAAPEFPNMTKTGGEIETYPVLASNTVPLGVVAAVHAPSVAYGDDDGVDVEADPSASIQMDDAPTQASTTPTPSQVVSMRQTRSIYMQATHFVGWRKLRADCVNFISNATWNASASV